MLHGSELLRNFNVAEVAKNFGALFGFDTSEILGDFRYGKLRNSWRLLLRLAWLHFPKTLGHRAEVKARARRASFAYDTILTDRGEFNSAQL